MQEECITKYRGNCDIDREQEQQQQMQEQVQETKRVKFTVISL